MCLKGNVTSAHISWSSNKSSSYAVCGLVTSTCLSVIATQKPHNADWVLLVTVSVPPLLDKPKQLIRWHVNVLGESSRGVSLINRLSLAS